MEAKLPAPVLQVVPRYPGRNYCEVCEKSWVKKGKKLQVHHVESQKCRSVFFKDSYMKTFPEIVRNVQLRFDQPSSSWSQSPDDETSEQPTVSLRSSSRKRCRYETNRLNEKTRIICNIGNKTNKKGHLLPVVLSL